MMKDEVCVFCEIAKGKTHAHIVYEDDEAVAFLDLHPLFPGHVLLCPRKHYETLTDLPVSMAGLMMEKTQLLARAVEDAMNAEGTFIAVNNRVSQSVPHLHIHVVPRRKRDGLKGFFWPRRPYLNDDARTVVCQAIQQAVQKLLV